jgi:hypothetical protein
MFSILSISQHALKDVQLAILMQHIVFTKLDLATDETAEVESIFEDECKKGGSDTIERLDFCQICERTQIRIRNWGGSTKNGRMGNEGAFHTPKKDMKGDTVFFGDDRWNLMSMIMIGIQVCLEKDESTIDERDSDDEDDRESQTGSVASKSPSVLGRAARSATISFNASTMTKVNVLDRGGGGGGRPNKPKQKK